MKSGKIWGRGAEAPIDLLRSAANFDNKFIFSFSF